MRILLAVLGATLLACGKDECEKMLDELATVEGGVKLTGDARKAALDRCRATLKGEAPAPTTASAPALPKNEAVTNLEKLATNVKLAHQIDGKFPIANLPVTPANACCGQSDNRCAPAPDTWKRFEGLAFEMTEPHFFRYSYESSDGATYTARAVGDTDCDGAVVTYTLRGRISDGKVTHAIAVPTTAD